MTADLWLSFETEILDALVPCRRDGRRLRRMGDEELHRERLALQRLEVLAGDLLPGFLERWGDVNGLLYLNVWLTATKRARATVEREEERRERARALGVPRDAPGLWVPEEVVADIKARLDLADLIGRWGLADLKALGEGRYVGRCPFHDDRTPSFYVYTGDPSDQHYHCMGIGCQAHGDAFDLARQHAGWLSFREAAEGLAALAGVAWPPPDPAPPVAAPAPDYVALAERGV
jgi:hypothetical protein